MQYQIIVNCDSHAELQEVVNVLGRVPATHSSAPALAHTTSTLLPTSQPVDEEDDGVGAVNPAAVFGSQSAAEVFAPNPNVGAMAHHAPAHQPASSAGSQTQGDVELDPRGFPWDNRIHSSNRTRLKESNCWKYARGKTQAEIDAVEAELISKGFGASRAAQAFTQSPATVPASPVAQTLANEMPIGLPGLPSLPGAIAAQPTGPNAESLKERFTKAIAMQLVNAGWILEVLNSFGVPNLQALDTHPDAIKPINDYLNTCKQHPGFESI